MAWTIEDLLAATGGRLQGQAPVKRFGEIVTDSNKVKQGAVFVALKGDRFDGHRFVKDAARRGAACLMIHRAVRALDRRRITVVKVPDTLRALGDLAHFRRERYAPKVLAVTGSNGKTTTKEMLAAILEEACLNGNSLKGTVLKTEGNFNNLVGLPLTLLRLRKSHRVAVIEMGTNRPGEIARLAEIAAPDVGMITSVAAAHLEGLNSLAGVTREKGALFSGVRAGGAIALNLDDPRVRRLGEKFRGRKITYGEGGDVRAETTDKMSAAGVRFTLCAGAQRRRVRLQFIGRHNIANAVGAAAMAHALGIDLSAIGRGLEKAQPYAMRMQLESRRGIGIINDSYNANPASMAAAVETLKEIQGGGRRIAVLGDMFELGKRSLRQHSDLGVKLAAAAIDYVCLLGSHATDVRRGALRGGMKAERIFVARSHGEIGRWLSARLKKGDWLLIKGSRGMKMELVLPELHGLRQGE